MKALSRYVETLARSVSSRPDLFDALTGHGRLRYALHRMRFFVPRVLLRTLLHAVEIVFLAQYASAAYVAPLLGYRALTALLSGTSWGVLESLRNGVRHDVARGHPQRARGRIEAWLSLARGAAGLSMSAMVAWVLFRPDFEQEPGITLPDAYGLACVLRFGLELVARTYQAGLAALRRVHRPFSLSIAPDLLELSLLILAWQKAGPWGFPLAITLGGVLRVAITLRYARRGYDDTRVGRPRRVSLRRGLSRLTREELRLGVMHGLANTTTQVDALLLFVLSHAPRGNESAVTFAMLFYVLRPVIGAAAGFTRLFYFDWKRLERGFGAVFRPAFRRMLLAVGAGVAVGALALVALPFAFVPSQPAPLAVYALGPFLFARGLFALEQLELFSLGALRPLLSSSAFVLGVVVIAWIARLGETATMLVTSAALFASVTAQVQARRREPPQAFGPALPSWLCRLAAEGPVHMAVLQVDARIASVAKVRRALGRERRDIVRLSAHRLALFETAPVDEARARRLSILTDAGGALVALDVAHFPSGLAAREAPALQRLLPPREAHSDEALCAAFAPLGGTVIDLVRGQGGVRTERAARRALVQRLAGFPQARRRRDQAEVAVLYRRGAPALAFVIPRAEPRFRDFARRVERASVTDAVTTGAGR